MIEKTILEVRIKDNKKVWVITRHDADTSLIGEVTSSGTPARASDLPVGTTFESILMIP